MSDVAIPEDFVAALRIAANNVGWTFDRMDDDGQGIVFADKQGVPQSIGLPRFYKRFADADPNDWPTQITAYLQTVSAIAKQPASDELDAQAEHVLVRLGRPYPSTPPVSVWGRPLPHTDLGIMLVVSSGHGFRYVREDEIAASTKSADEWYDIGLANLKAKTPDGCVQVLEPDTGLLACGIGDNLDASRGLFLADLLPQPYPHGVLASVPHRDALLMLPLTPNALQQRALALLKVFTQNLHGEATHPISTEIFWVQGGVWRPFGIEVSERGVRIQPPAEANAMIDALFAEADAK